MRHEREPARRAMSKAGANSASTPRRSSLDRPKPTTLPGPSPAYRAARAARGSARRAGAGSDSPRRPRRRPSRRPRRSPPRRGRSPGRGSGPRRTARSCSARPGSPASASPRRRRPRPPRARSGAGRLAAHARAGQVVEPLEAEQPRSSVACSRGGVQSCSRPSTRSASGRRTPCRSASAPSVRGRIDPVKCRCRCALGSAATSRTTPPPPDPPTMAPPCQNGSASRRTACRWGAVRCRDGAAPRLRRPDDLRARARRARRAGGGARLGHGAHSWEAVFRHDAWGALAAAAVSTSGSGWARW